MRYIKEDMQGHIRAWAALAKKHGSITSQHPITHEVWQYMGSTDTHHEFRHRDLMVDGVEKGKYAENIPVEAGDFNYLTRYEYTTRLIPFTNASANALFGEMAGKFSVDHEMEQQGWNRAWAEHVDNGSFIVYRRLRDSITQAQGAVL